MGRVVKEQLEIQYGNNCIYGELLHIEGIEEIVPTIICVPDEIYGCKNMKKMVGKELATRGYAVYCFDFIESMAIDKKMQLLSIIDCIKKLNITDKSNIYLLGEGTGGMVAALTAVERISDIKGLILYYPKPYVGTFQPVLHEKIYLEDRKLDIYNYISLYDKPVMIICGAKATKKESAFSKKLFEYYEEGVMSVIEATPYKFSKFRTNKAAELAGHFIHTMK